VIDVILGAIAITSGSRNLQTYVADMVERGQTKERIDEVSSALKLYNSMFSPKKIVRFVKREEEKKEEEVSYTQRYNKIQDQFELKEKLEALTEDQKKYKNDLRELKKVCKEKIPEDLSCPITGEIFYEPVMAEDGHTYEKTAIEVWLEKFDTSPVETNLKLNKNFIPNQSVKRLVKRYLESHKEAIPVKKISLDT